jgi:hypothetical protein
MKDLCQHPMELEERADWVIWQGPGRGYVALENGLPPIADALQALWFLRAQRHEIDTISGASFVRPRRPSPAV